MDRFYLSDVIRRIEQEKAVHDEKFSNSAVHADCLPRFEMVLEKLRQELEKLDDRRELESSTAEGL